MSEHLVDSSTEAPRRRTQGERSEAMRQRLVEATLNCLESVGYASTTVSRIVEAAQVSRGAPVHHFPSKAALIEAAAEQLVRRVYILLGHTIQQVGESEDRLAEIILTSWKAVFGTRENAVMLELMVASKHDAELAAVMRKLWTAGYDTIGVAADHYFEPLSAGDNVRQLMVLTQWLLRGMAMDLHLIRDERIFEHFLALWSRVLASHMRARPGVTQPPPRPAYWDSSLADLPLDAV
jgi:AcrR family transcriptional regulator